MESLFAPWRYSYLVEARAQGECIFCAARARADEAGSLLLYQGAHNFVILNLYPYTNGHMLVVPNGHVASPSLSAPEARAEMMDLATACETALRDTYSCDGINMGMNIGKAAGAGIQDHYHLHVLPRWEGDTNFMAVTARTRIIPEELAVTRDRLRRALDELLGPGRGGSRV
ncbi:MAG TPA: HIT domain-containing protein [Candidatus Polarisedimenticolia bacterium]|jgi:ATP adenylyltransferase